MPADEAPMFILFMAPVVAGLIVTVPVPDGDRVTEADAGDRVTVLDAPNVLNEPVPADEAPMFMLLIAPVVVGAIVTDPPAVGDIVTEAAEGDSVTVLDAPNEPDTVVAGLLIVKVPP